MATGAAEKGREIVAEAERSVSGAMTEAEVCLLRDMQAFIEFATPQWFGVCQRAERASAQHHGHYDSRHELRRRPFAGFLAEGVRVFGNHCGLRRRAC